MDLFHTVCFQLARPKKFSKIKLIQFIEDVHKRFKSHLVKYKKTVNTLLKESKQVIVRLTLFFLTDLPPIKTLIDK